MKEPGILFVDLHGTLIPTAFLISRAFADFVHSRCPSVSKRKLVRYYLDFQGTPLEEKVLHGLHLGGRKQVSKTELNALMKQLWNQIVQMPLKPYPETVADLNELKSRGWKLFLSTDNPAWVARAFLEKTGLRSLFFGVLGQPRAGVHKVTAHVQQLALQFGIGSGHLKNRVAFYGDSLGEMQAARKAGIIAIGRTTSYSQHAMRKAGAHAVVVGSGVLVQGRLKRHLARHVQSPKP